MILNLHNLTIPLSHKLIVKDKSQSNMLAPQEVLSRMYVQLTAPTSSRGCWVHTNTKHTQPGPNPATMQNMHACGV